MRMRVALRAFLALLAALAADVRRPRATAAGFFFGITVGSIQAKYPLDKRATVR